jgi:integrase
MTMPKFTGKKERIKFTEGTVDKLQVPEGKKDELWFDAELPGFFIRKFASGKATYGVKYTCKGKQRRLTLGKPVRGNLAKMRALASEAMAAARLGTDMAALAKAEAKAKRRATVGELVPAYLKIREQGSDDMVWKALRPNSLKDVVHYLNRAWQPFHALTPDAVTRDKIIDRMAELSTNSGPIAAKRAHAALSTFFAWLIHNKHRSGDNPTMGIKLMEEKPRTRALKEPELVDVWLATPNDDFGAIVKLLILTAQRLREIGNLEWPEIELEKRWIDLPEARTKNKRPHRVPLSAPALALLRAIPRHEGSRLVFLGRLLKGMTSYSWDKARLDERIAEMRGAPLPHWTLHDLRRSVVTQLSESRERRRMVGRLEEIETYSFAQPHIVEAVVNHVSGYKAGVAGTYVVATYLAEKRQALEQWAAHFIGLVDARLKLHQGNIAENAQKSEEFGSQPVSVTGA